MILKKHILLENFVKTIYVSNINILLLHTIVDNVLNSIPK